MPIPPGHIGWTWSGFDGSPNHSAAYHTIQQAVTITQDDWLGIQTDAPPAAGLTCFLYRNGSLTWQQWAFGSSGLVYLLPPPATSAYAAGEVLMVEAFTTQPVGAQVNLWIGVVDAPPPPPLKGFAQVIA